MDRLSARSAVVRMVLCGLAAAWLVAMSPGCDLSRDDKDRVDDSDPLEPGPDVPVESRARVLVAYTQEARDGLVAQGDDPVADAAFRVEATNLAFSNSGISVTVELADVIDLSSEAAIFAEPECNGEPESPDCAGQWLSNSLARGEDVATARDRARADFVVLLMAPYPRDEDLPDDVAGKARGTPRSRDPVHRASATALTDDTLVFVHEVGHLFGAGHDRHERGEPLGTTSVINYGQSLFGSRVRTIMAYPDECESLYGEYDACPRVAWFTNPSVSVDGLPLGSATEFNACAIQFHGGAVSSYYEARIHETPFLPPPPLSSCPYGTLPYTHDVRGRYCEGSYDISTVEELTVVEGCGTIEGRLDIRVPELTTLESLSSLTHVGERLVLSTGATSLEGLESLESVGSLEIMSPVESLLPLEHLTQVESIEIRNASLTDLAGLQNVRALQHLTITNSSFGSLWGLLGTTSLASLRLEAVSGLTSLDGLAHVADIASIDVMGASELVHLGPPVWLRTLSSLSIIDCPALERLTGLEAVASLPGGLTLALDPSLQSLAPLGSMTTAASITLEELDGLVDLHGLEQVETVDGMLLISNNDSLVSTGAMSSLQQASSVVVIDNALLTSCDFPSLSDEVDVVCALE